MRKYVFIVGCFLIFQTVVLGGALDAKDVGVQESDFPRAFLPKTDGSVKVWKQGETITVTSNKSTLEEILERIAVEKKMILRFYCQDPSLKRERTRDLKISADSLEKVLQQLLSEEDRFTFLNREGKPAEDGKDIAAVNIYSKGCAGTDPPVRVFDTGREQRLLDKSQVEQIPLEKLHDTLKNGGPASRRWAADILGRKADEKGIAYAKEALKDENAGVMFAAATALNRLGEKYGAEKVADDIYSRFREKPYAEFLPVMAVVDKNRLWPFIDALMDQSGEREKGIMVRALFLTKDGRAVKYLLRISSTSPGNSKQAIYSIGQIGGPEAATALISLLRGQDALRQAWAAQAVKFLSKEDGVKARTEVEKVVREERVPDALLQGLAEIKYLEPLGKLIRDPASKKELKIRALKALSKGGQSAIEVMGMGLNDKAPQVRLASVEAMTPLAADEAIPYLIRATQDQDAKVRRSATKGLSEFSGNENVLEALGKTINDPNESVRKEAVDALELMGEPNEKMKAILDDCKKSKDPYVVDKASSIMRHWGLMN